MSAETTYTIAWIDPHEISEEKIATITYTNTYGITRTNAIEEFRNEFPDAIIIAAADPNQISLLEDKLRYLEKYG